MTTYPFVTGIDYGPRDGTLGLEFHMSEGGDGLVSYLARHAGEDLWEWADRVNGVSCNAAILSTGKVYQMVPWDHASGNLNPDDRAGEYGYYGHQTLVDVLGDHWPDPNMWSISVELAGRRADGPTDAQVRSAIAWGRDMIASFGTLRGNYGHHDQSPKGCPGTTPNMRAIFDGLGGHGFWTQEGNVRFATVITGKLLPVPKGYPWSYFDGSPGGVFGSAQSVIVRGKADAHNGQWLVEGNTGNPYDDLAPRPTLILVASSAALVDAPAPVDTYTKAQLDQAVSDGRAAEHERVRAAAIAAAEGL